MEQGYAAGALGYVLKLDAARDLVPAVRAALRGERYRSAHGPNGWTAPDEGTSRP